MSSIEYAIENSPKTADDKVVRDGIVNFNGQLINEEATHFSVFAKDDTQIMIDDIARDKRLPKIFVDTYAFQAQDFYKKHGFFSIGTIPKYLKDHDRIFMRKDVS